MIHKGMGGLAGGDEEVQGPIQCCFQLLLLLLLLYAGWVKMIYVKYFSFYNSYFT